MAIILIAISIVMIPMITSGVKSENPIQHNTTSTEPPVTRSIAKSRDDEPILSISTTNDEPAKPKLTKSIFETIDPSTIDDSLLNTRVNHETVNRYRIVKIDTDQLRTHMRAYDPSRPLHLPLFDDFTIMGMPTKVKEYYEGERSGYGTWTGSVNGDEKSVMSIVVAPGGETKITIMSEEGNFNVSQLGDTNAHLVLDLAMSSNRITRKHGIDVVLPENSDE